MSLAKETHARSVLKAITYRILAFAYLFLIARYLFHLGLDLSLAFASIDFIFKIAVYYLNERVWTHIKWGYGKPKVDVIEEVLDDGPKRHGNIKKDS